MKRNRAFTLIELLVVIAIIAILLSVMIPSLKKAKELAMRTICLGHLHSLGQAWVLYSEQNDAKLPNAVTARIVETASSGTKRNFAMQLNPADRNFYEITWVGWPSDSLLNDPIAQQSCITLGSMYPLLETEKMYRCPVGQKDQYRTYSIVDFMNGYKGFEYSDSYPITHKITRKMNEIRSPSTQLVFIDEGVATTESWTINYAYVQWWDPAPLRHGEGTTVAMADGSSEYWKWRNQNTIDFSLGVNTNSVTTAVNNEDFTKLQRACWGKSAKP